MTCCIMHVGWMNKCVTRPTLLLSTTCIPGIIQRSLSDAMFFFVVFFLHVEE